MTSQPAVSDDEADTRTVPGFARRHEVIQMSQTSMPVWASTPLVLPFPASSLVGIAFGEDAVAQVRDLFTGSPVPTETLAEESAWAEGIGDRLTALIERQLVGVRFVVVGPEQDIMRVKSLLRLAGAVAGEVTAHSTDVAEGYLPEGETRRVFCGYCHVIQPVTAAIGEAITCVGCGAGLNVHYHYSRPQAAYLGVPNGEDLVT